MNYSDYIDKWLASLSVKTNSKAIYLNQVNLFFKNFDVLNSNNVEIFLQRGMSEQKRVYARKYAMKSFLKYLAKHNLINLDDYEDALNVRYSVKERREIQTLTYDNLVPMLKKMKWGKLKVVCMIAFDTGARIQSILKLRVKDVYSDKTVYLREKDDKNIIKLLTEETYNHLQKYIKTKSKGRYVFLDVEQATYEVLKDEYYQLWSELKNFSRKIFGVGVSFHWIRRGAGVYWYDKTDKDIMAVQGFLDHESTDQTRKYLKLKGEIVKEKMKDEKRDW